MPRFHRFVALSIICAGCVFGQPEQGSFAQIAYGGGWQTTFTLVNPSETRLAFVTLNFFGDNGLPLNVPIQDAETTTSYTFQSFQADNRALYSPARIPPNRRAGPALTSAAQCEGKPRSAGYYRTRRSPKP